MDGLDRQYLEIRAARKALFTCDTSPLLGCDIDIEASKCDEMIDWDVFEPRIIAQPQPVRLYEFMHNGGYRIGYDTYNQGVVRRSGAELARFRLRQIAENEFWGENDNGNNAEGSQAAAKRRTRRRAINQASHSGTIAGPSTDPSWFPPASFLAPGVSVYYPPVNQSDFGHDMPNNGGQSTSTGPAHGDTEDGNNDTSAGGVNMNDVSSSSTEHHDSEFGSRKLDKGKGKAKEQ